MNQDNADIWMNIITSSHYKEINMALSKKAKAKATKKAACVQHKDKDGNLSGRNECVLCGA